MKSYVTSPPSDTHHSREDRGATGVHLLPVISKAKKEWECTADALSAVVCLLSETGIVLRANRAVEGWGLGSVSAAVGKSAHAMLHPFCTAAPCKLSRCLDEALPYLRAGHPREFEYHSNATHQTLQIVLRPMRSDEDLHEAQHDTRIVLLVNDVSVLRQAQRELTDLNADLEHRVRQRTRQLADSNRELRHEVARREIAERELLGSRNNLALLSEQLIQAQENERKRIALELHDSVGQSLSAIKYTLERALVIMQRSAGGNLTDTLSSVVEQVHETAENIRAISKNLRPHVLDNLGAASATSWFCREFSEIYPEIELCVTIGVQNADIPDRIATHLYRSVEELLNNVAKHAAAKTAWVTLHREGWTLSLEVRDDGRGMARDDGDEPQWLGSGIRNLRERAQMAGGKFTLTSEPGRGATAQITWLLELLDLQQHEGVQES